MEKVNDGIYKSVSGYVNAYIIDGDEGVTLIDTGVPKRLESISSALVGIGRRLADVKTIVITHGHADHYGSAAAVKAESKATLIASAIDAPILRGDVEAPVPPFMEKYRFLKPLAALMPGAHSVEVDQVVTGDEAINLVSDLTAIQTPGHTEGHLSLLLDRGGRILFVGDAAVSDRSGAIKRGFINLPTETFDNSLRKIAAHDFETAYFGHAKPITSGADGAFRQFVEAL